MTCTPARARVPTSALRRAPATGGSHDSCPGFWTAGNTRRDRRRSSSRGTSRTPTPPMRHGSVSRHRTNDATGTSAPAAFDDVPAPAHDGGSARSARTPRPRGSRTQHARRVSRVGTPPNPHVALPAVVVAASLHYIFHWPTHGGDNFISGPLADITLVTAFVGTLVLWWRRHNCHSTAAGACSGTRIRIMATRSAGSTTPEGHSIRAD